MTDADFWQNHKKLFSGQTEEEYYLRINFRIRSLKTTSNVRPTRRAFPALVLFSLLFLLFAYSLSFVFGPTGFVIREGYITKTLDINTTYTGTTYIPLTLHNLRTLTITGTLTGEGEIILHSENQSYLVYSSNISNESYALDYFPDIAFNDTCDQTCSLPDITTTVLEIRLPSSTLHLDKITYTFFIRNRKPSALAPVPSFSMRSNRTLSSLDYFSDLDEDELSFTLTPNPYIRLAHTGHDLIFASTGIPGEYTLTLTVSDGTDNITSNPFTVTVLDKEPFTISESARHPPIRIGVPVIWEKNITAQNSLNTTTEKPVTFSLPREATRLSISKISDNTTLNPAILVVEDNATDITYSFTDTFSPETLTNYILSYETPSPTLTEETLSASKKRITISSTLPYENIIARTIITPAEKSTIYLYHIVNGERQPFPISGYIDPDGDGLIDIIEWTVPHLSEQVFEVDIIILNVQSFPMIGGNWTVLFNTTGTADLSISAVNGTTYNTSPSDLTPVMLQCNSTTLNYSWIGNDSITYADYSCDNATGSWIVHVNTGGSHHQEFSFGNATVFADNYASGAFRLNLNVSGSGDNTSNASFWGEAASDTFGLAVNGIGDFNKDGYDDFMICAPAYSGSKGKGYIVFGRPSVWNMDTSAFSTGDNKTNGSFQGEAASDSACSSYQGGVGVGDVNGDGYADIVMTASGRDNSGANNGEAYLIFGNNSGWGYNISLANANASYYGEQGSGSSGLNFAAGLGDVNGDGYDDFAIGDYATKASNASAAGKVYVFFGRAASWQTDQNITMAANATFLGYNISDNLGARLDGVGDVNNDGFDDFLLSASTAKVGASVVGKLYLVYGRNTTWSRDINVTGTSDNTTNASFFGLASDNMGNPKWIGDVNGDTRPDLGMSASGRNSSKGETYFWLGGTAFTLGMYPNGNTVNNVSNVSVWGEGANDYSGWQFSGAGDMNNDGYDDIIIGAYYRSQGPTNNGKVHIVFGRNSGFSMNMTSASNASFIGTNASDYLGITVGYAGDVNGDLFDDVIVGAPYVDSNGATNGGEAYLIFGQGSGDPILNISSLTVFSDSSYINDITNSTFYLSNPQKLYIQATAVGGSNLRVETVMILANSSDHSLPVKVKLRETSTGSNNYRGFIKVRTGATSKRFNTVQATNLSTLYFYNYTNQAKYWTVRADYRQDPCSPNSTWVVTDTVNCTGKSIINATSLVIGPTGHLVTNYTNVNITGNVTINASGSWDAFNSKGSIWVGGNITVNGYANFTNVTLRMNVTCDGCGGINVTSTGTLVINDSTNITYGENVNNNYFFTVEQGANLTITNSNIEFAGWNDPGTGELTPSYGLMVMTNNSVFRNVTFQNNYYDIFLWYANNTLIDNCSMTAARGGWSPVIYTTTGNNFTNMRVTTIAGAWIDYSANMTFENVSFSGGSDIALQLTGSSDNTFRNFHASSSADAPVFLQVSSNRNIFLNSTISSASGRAVALSSSNLTVFSSTIFSSVASGSLAKDISFPSSQKHVVEARNSTINSTKIDTGSGSRVIIRSFVRAYVADTQGNAVSGVNVTTLNLTSQEENYSYTDIQGNSAFVNLTQLFVSGTTDTRTDYNNYTFILSKNNYFSETVSYNITNGSQYNVTLYSYCDFNGSDMHVVEDLTCWNRTGSAGLINISPGVNLTFINVTLNITGNVYIPQNATFAIINSSPAWTAFQGSAGNPTAVRVRMQGNMSVNGTLNITNTALGFNGSCNTCAGLNITGNITINGSKITRAESATNYFFTVYSPSNLTIQSSQIEYCGWGAMTPVSDPKGGLLIKSNNSIIINTTFINNSVDIRFSMANNSYIVNNTFESPSNGYNMVLGTSSRYNNITNNTFNGTKTGIYFSGSDNNSFTNNYINVSENGIYLASSHNETIKHNFIAALGSGLRLFTSSDNWIYDVNITDGSEYYGILIVGHRNLFQYVNVHWYSSNSSAVTFANMDANNEFWRSSLINEGYDSLTFFRGNANLFTDCYFESASGRYDVEGTYTASASFNTILLNASLTTRKVLGQPGDKVFGKHRFNVKVSDYAGVVQGANVSIINGSSTLENWSLSDASGLSPLLNLSSFYAIFLNSNPSWESNFTIFVNKTGYHNKSVSVNISQGYPYNITINVLPTVAAQAASPSPQGYGNNVTIGVNFSDSDGINDVSAAKVEIDPPGSPAAENFTMTEIGTVAATDRFQYNYTGWHHGNYSYKFWIYDASTDWIDTAASTFEVNANITINVRTIKDTYSQMEVVYLTDPPDEIFIPPAIPASRLPALQDSVEQQAIAENEPAQKARNMQRGLVDKNKDTGPPFITNAFANPPDVYPGDNMTISADIIDPYGIISASAIMPHEKGVDNISLKLTKGTTYNGTWQVVWPVHDTIKKAYTTTITATNTQGKSATFPLSWTDVTYVWIDQDVENVSSYSRSGALYCTNPANGYDEGWGTMTNSGSNVCYIFINYTIPRYVTSIKDELKADGSNYAVVYDCYNHSSGAWINIGQSTTAETINITPPAACLNGTNLSMRFVSVGDLGEPGGQFFEDKAWWYKKVGPYYDNFINGTNTTNIGIIGAADTSTALILQTNNNQSKIAWESNVTINSTWNFDDVITFNDSYLYVNTNFYPNLNAKATVTISNLYYRDFILYKDGSLCTDCLIISNTGNGTITFNVSGFSNYTWAEGNQSKITNNGTTAVNVSLLIKIQYYNSTDSIWYDEALIVNITNVSIAAGGSVKLDDFFNGFVNTSDDLIHGSGWYRVNVSLTNASSFMLTNYSTGAISSVYNFSYLNNSVPIVQYVQLLPPWAQTNDSLTIYANCTDADVSDSVTASYTFYKNGTNTSSGTASITKSTNATVATLSDSSTTKSDIWTASVSCKDSYNSSAYTNSSTVTIQNSVPQTNLVLLLPTNPNTTAYLNCTFAIADNDTTDRLTVFYRWYNNSEQYSNGTLVYSLTNNYTLLSNATTSKGDTWTCSINATDDIGVNNFTNSSSVTIANTIPTVPALEVPTSENFTVHNRSTTFNWSNSTDMDGDAITYDIDISSDTACAGGGFTDTGLTVSQYTYASELCTQDETSLLYNWTVRACDPTGCSAWTTPWNFSIEPWIVIAFATDSIDFGTWQVSDENTWNDTSDNHPPPFVIENNGNVYSNLTNVTANASLWRSPLAGLGTHYFQIKVDETAESTSFDWGTSQTTYMNLTSTNQSLINRLGYNPLANSAQLDINITLPQNEPAGNKTAAIILWFEQTPSTAIPSCDGYYALGYCWYQDNTTETSCDTICLDHGGCVNENWNDNNECSVCAHFNQENEGCFEDASSYTPLLFRDGVPNGVCNYRDSGTSQDCASTGPDEFAYRMCACET